MQCLVNMADESELPGQAVTVLPGHQRNMRSCVILMEDYAFLLTNSGRFVSSAAFSWSNWEQYLLELIVWFSGRTS